MNRFALLAVSLVVGLGASECAVRWSGFAPEVMREAGYRRFVDNLKLVYEFVPGSTIDSNPINMQGFNDSEFALEKPRGVVRIAMLGDSITQGSYVPARDNFSEKLESLLNERARMRRIPTRYEVMNFGVGGYNLAAEVETLKEKVLPYEPDIVVLNMFSNDNEPIPGVYLLFAGNQLRLTEEERLSLARRYVLNRDSLLRRFERDVLYRSKLYLLAVSTMHAKRDGAALSKVTDLSARVWENMDVVEQGFREISGLRKRHGFKFLICTHPWLFRDGNGNNPMFADIARKFDFESFHMLSHYGDLVERRSLRLKDHPRDDCHPNESGHALIAEALFLELKKRGLIDPRL